MGLRAQPSTGTGICDFFGKERLTKSGAKSLAKRQARSSGENLQAYFCRSCEGWHVGAKRRIR